MNALGLGRIRRAFVALLGAAACLGGGVQAAPEPALHLRIVGGLGSLNQFTRHEKPFWETELARLSGGRYTAEIAPFDRAGIRSQEALTLVQLGAVPFATVHQGAAAIRKAMTALKEQGRRYGIVDAVTDEDLHAIGQAAESHALITGGSGVAIGLPENFRNRPILQKPFAKDDLAKVLKALAP